ncbi:hypothetical protein BHM03_00047884 [Ensete ventricosum]|nr:hypothetical protein BHM03_00047884 [Ensete ventricosum]
MVLQRWDFRVCASKLTSESLGHQHMGAVYHRGRSQISSTSESHGGDLIIQRYDQSGWRVGLLQCLHSLKGARQVRGQGRVDAGVLDQGTKSGSTRYCTFSTQRSRQKR